MDLGMAKFLECCNQVRVKRDTIGACRADKLAHIVAVFLIYEGAGWCGSRRMSLRFLGCRSCILNPIWTIVWSVLWVRFYGEAI